MYKYNCDLCDYRSKGKTSLKVHKANKHNIGVTWYHCDLCDYRSIQNFVLKRHKADIHEIE